MDQIAFPIKLSLPQPTFFSLLPSPYLTVVNCQLGLNHNNQAVRNHHFPADRHGRCSFLPQARWPLFFGAP